MQAGFSYHISIMNKAGLVKTRNEGKVFCYSIDKHFVNEVIDLFMRFIIKCRKVFTLKSIKCLFNRFFWCARHGQ